MKQKPTNQPQPRKIKVIKKDNKTNPKPETTRPNPAIIEQWKNDLTKRKQAITPTQAKAQFDALFVS